MAGTSRDRLNHLLELAARGADGRALLLDDLGDLLTDWPADYAQAMRGPFEALFEKTAREAEPQARARLAERFASHPGFPVALLNELYLDAPPSARAQILRRNEALDDEDGPAPPRADGTALVAAARKTMNGAFAEVFASTLSLPRELAGAVLDDPDALAVACKGAGLSRAAYSAIAVMRGAPASALAGFDQVPQAAAERLARFWRLRA